MDNAIGYNPDFDTGAVDETGAEHVCMKEQVALSRYTPHPYPWRYHLLDVTDFRTGRKLLKMIKIHFRHSDMVCLVTVGYGGDKRIDHMG
jgi:hypothetical protein